MTKHDLKIFADYSQIYIEDLSVVGQYEIEWNDEQMQTMLATEKNALVISTARNTTVPFTLEYWESKPDVALENWDHVIECSIELPSGVLSIAGTTDFIDDAFKLQLPKGLYGALSCYKGLDTISVDGLEGNDCYQLYLWKENNQLSKKVLKQWTPG